MTKQNNQKKLDKLFDKNNKLFLKLGNTSSEKKKELIRKQISINQKKEEKLLKMIRFS
jgi:hypothetical protein